MKRNFDFIINNLENVFTNEKHKLAMKGLKYEEKEILYYLVVLDFSVTELSEILNISRQEIRRIRRNAIEHFKKNYNEISQNENLTISNNAQKNKSSKSKGSKKGGGKNE